MQRITSTLLQRLSPANAVADQYDACGSSECSALTASINQTNIACVPPLLLHAILTRHAVQCPYRSASILGINFTMYSSQNYCCCCFLHHYPRSHLIQRIDGGHTHLLIIFVHKNTQVLHCVGAASLITVTVQAHSHFVTISVSKSYWVVCFGDT